MQKSKNISARVLILSLFFIYSHFVQAQIPSSLIPWYQYALKIFPPEDCPHLIDKTTQCAAVSQVSFSGDVGSGWLQLTWTGENLSLTSQTIDLIGPAATFTIDESEVVLDESERFPRAFADDKSAAPYVGPFFNTPTGLWQAIVPPGHFIITGQISFDPVAVLPLKLTSKIGKLDDSLLSGGTLQFDPTSGPYEGDLTIVTKLAAQLQASEKPKVRVTRVFQWGSLAHFKYVVNVDGVSKETSVTLPLLGGEMIESVTPQRRTSQENRDGKSVLSLSVSPDEKQVVLEGHFKEKPTEMVASEMLPFEIWLELSDARYPTEISTDATPIDPDEFAAVTDISRAHAYLLKPGQKMVLTPVLLSIDEGRKGSGSFKYQLFEGGNGFWLEKFNFNGKLFGQDRLILPTPHDPVYAGFDALGIELYQDDEKRLSVRIPPEGLQNLEVDWHENRAASSLGGIFHFKTAPQTIYQDEASGQIVFRPGVVPLLAWGAESINGDLRDQFHLYGLLIGIFVFFVCRGLRFSMPLAVLTSLLFVELYTQSLFPRTATVVLLLLTLPATMIKGDALESLHRKPFLRACLRLVWWVAFLIALVPLCDYTRVRLYSAIHPQADFQSSLFLGSLGYGSSSYSTGMNYENADDQYTQTKSIGRANFPSPAPNVVQKYESEPEDQSMKLKKDWKPRPVNIQTTSQQSYLWKSREALRFSSRNLLEGQELQITAITAGPLLRAAWLVLESIVIFAMLIAVYVRAQVLARRADEI